MNLLTSSEERQMRNEASVSSRRSKSLLGKAAGKVGGAAKTTGKAAGIGALAGAAGVIGIANRAHRSAMNSADVMATSVGMMLASSMALTRMGEHSVMTSMHRMDGMNRRPPMRLPYMAAGMLAQKYASKDIEDEPEM